MLTRYALPVAFVALVGSGLARGQQPAATADGGTYHVSETFKIGGTGGWDYLTVDPEHKLLYVPRSTHTMVLDEASGKAVADIPGQTGNHGVAIVPEVGRGFITDGKGAAVVVFDAKTNEALGRIKAVPDADGIIYDPACKKVLFVSGDEGVLIPIDPNVDPKTGKTDTAVDLGGKPEFLASDNAGKVFVNLEDKNQVAVVDTKTMKVLDHWSTAPGGAPVGMAIDREHHQIFVGCRNPQKLVVMNTEDGEVVADLPIGAGVDAVQYDAASGHAFASCRDGTLAVAARGADGKFAILQTVKTAAGARTMGLDPVTHALYLPTAEFQAGGGARPAAKPDTFMVIVVRPAGG